MGKKPRRRRREARAFSRDELGTTDALAGSGFMNRWMGDAGAYAQAALAEEDAADRVDNA